MVGCGVCEEKLKDICRDVHDLALTDLITGLCWCFFTLPDYPASFNVTHITGSQIRFVGFPPPPNFESVSVLLRFVYTLDFSVLDIISA